MDLLSWVSAERGRQTTLANAIGCQSQLVWQWSNDARPIPDARCPAIERATGGAVTCEEQRPDIRWRRVPDDAWPWHAAGRPLIDLTPEEAALPAAMET